MSWACSQTVYRVIKFDAEISMLIGSSVIKVVQQVIP